MKRIMSLLCLSAFLFCFIASSSYATTSDDTDTQSSAVVMQDDQTDMADDATVTDEEQPSEDLHVKMSPSDIDNADTESSEEQ